MLSCLGPFLSVFALTQAITGFSIHFCHLSSLFIQSEWLSFGGVDNLIPLFLENIWQNIHIVKEKDAKSVTTVNN
jgi:hypothetical protein